MTLEEVTGEAEKWRDLLKSNLSEIAVKEIASRTAGKGGKETLLQDLVGLRETKAALVERLDTVLKNVEAKGGDATEYRNYIKANQGIDVDVKDTGAVWAAFSGWVVSAEGGIKWAKNIGLFLVVILVAWFLAKIISGIVNKAMKVNPHVTRLLRQFTVGIVRRLILIIGLIIALSSMGLNMGALVALLGGGAFVLGFAMQDTLSNFANGVMLMIYRPFDVDDVVDVGGVLGKVKSVNLVATHILTPDNKLILVPNKDVWGNVITNATATDKRRVDLVAGIGYEDDMAKAESVLEKILSDHKLILEDPAPVIKVHELADSSVNFVVRPWTKTSDYWTVYWDVTRQIKERFDAEGISIPYPQQDVHMHQAGS